MRSHPIGLAVRAFVPCFCLCLLPLPAAAQRVVLSYSPQPFVAPPVIESWNLATGALEWQRPGLLALKPVFTADGQYLVAADVNAAAPAFTVMDVVSGAVLTVPLAFAPIVAHPRTTAVLGLVQGVIGPGTDAARIDAGGLTVYGGCLAGTARHLDVSTDGGRVLEVCDSGELAVMDAGSGVTLRRVPVGPAGQLRQVASNLDGSRAIVMRGAGASSGDIALVDTTTGAVIATTVFPGASPLPSSGACVSGTMVGASPDRSRVVIECSWAYIDPLGGPVTFSTSSRLLDAETLAWGPDLGVRYFARALVLSPDNDWAFAFSTHPRGFGVYQLIALPAATTTAALSPPLPLGLAVAFAPLAPELTATVSAARVNLRWTLPAHSPPASSYVLEIGTGPGRSDLGSVTLGPPLALTVPGVPAGTYTARLRGVNAVGPGAASNEVTVVVP